MTSRNPPSRPLPVEGVVRQMVDDASFLRNGRSALVRSPTATLLHLSRHDERLEAAIDGVVLAGSMGARASLEGLERPGVGEVFLFAHCSVRRLDRAWIERLMALAGAMPEARQAFASALGWVNPEALRGVVASWLADSEATPRYMGIAACALHRIDPGDVLAHALGSLDAPVARRALQAAGELGRTDLLPACLERVQDADESIACSAGSAALLLGDRRRAFRRLQELAVKAGPVQQRALQAVLWASPVEAARELVRGLQGAGASRRLVVNAVGYSGDRAAVPWLIQQCRDAATARASGEAVGWITGVDLVGAGLERNLPDDSDPVPAAAAPEDDAVIDDDEGLPWPEPDGLERWWSQHEAGFQGGQRYFLGGSPDARHLRSVLERGTQRQRAAAAWLIALGAPGRPLFNVAAPAPRQIAWLGSPA